MLGNLASLASLFMPGAQDKLKGLLGGGEMPQSQPQQNGISMDQLFKTGQQVMNYTRPWDKEKTNAAGSIYDDYFSRNKGAI